MITAGDLYTFIDGWAPFSTAMDFDNVGLLVGDKTDRVSKALLALDITPAVAAEAQEKGAQLIISHHPVIFTPLKNIDRSSVPYFLVKAGIAAICAHTNLDLAQNGVNTCLAKTLKVSDIKPLAFYNGLPSAIIGMLGNTVASVDFAAHVKKCLSCEGVRYIEGNRPVHTVAMCCGAGGDMIFEAAAHGADAFVTGEMKHHEWLAGMQAGMTVVDAGHFKTEDIVLFTLQECLQSQFPQVEFAIAQSNTDAVRFL